MESLVHQRCFNHATREAVARCPECRRFFCRECITEHEERVLCSACLARLARRSPARRISLAFLFRLAQCGVGILVAWFFFFLIGQSLLKLPDSFHKEALWRAGAASGQ
jgi:hypothetical protein